jgi:hypothetical protein
LEETIAARKEDGLLVTVDHFHVLVAVV